MQQQPEAHAYSLGGTWIVTFSPEMPPGLPPIKIMNVATFGRGGVMIAAGSTHLLDMPQLRKLGDEKGCAGGEWISAHDHDFRYTYVSLIYKNGLPSGTQTETVVATMNDTGTEFSGVSIVEFRDLVGNIVFAGQATATAVRRAVHAAPTQSTEAYRRTGPSSPRPTRRGRRTGRRWWW
jgi:hypothetical protein